jgi:exoribonuclease R
LVEGKPYLLERAHIRDQTIYIKNYYKSMFPEQLRDVMSLMASQPRLAFSLSLDISEDGKIDYQSVKFYPSIIKVTQNITHGDKISNA